mmetsp:Transcript_15721/g.37462  ORF Transcript_15721/g.37462 Transcript_15721/m.37462 type:complete len:213 (+) Transcript_15721:644-1282(+)
MRLRALEAVHTQQGAPGRPVVPARERRAGERRPQRHEQRHEQQRREQRQCERQLERPPQRQQHLRRGHAAVHGARGVADLRRGGQDQVRRAERRLLLRHPPLGARAQANPLRRRRRGPGGDQSRPLRPTASAAAAEGPDGPRTDHCRVLAPRPRPAPANIRLRREAPCTRSLTRPQPIGAVAPCPEFHEQKAPAAPAAPHAPNTRASVMIYV